MKNIALFIDIVLGAFGLKVFTAYPSFVKINIFKNQIVFPIF